MAAKRKSTVNKIVHLRLTKNVPNPMADLRKRNLLHEKIIPKGIRLVLWETLRGSSHLINIWIHPSSQRLNFDSDRFAEIGVIPDENGPKLKLAKDILENSEEITPTNEDWVREQTWDWVGELKDGSKILARLLDSGKVSREDVLEAKKTK